MEFGNKEWSCAGHGVSHEEVAGARRAPDRRAARDGYHCLGFDVLFFVFVQGESAGGADFCLVLLKPKHELAKLSKREFLDGGLDFGNGGHGRRVSGFAFGDKAE